MEILWHFNAPKVKDIHNIGNSYSIISQHHHCTVFLVTSKFLAPLDLGFEGEALPVVSSWSSPLLVDDCNQAVGQKSWGMRLGVQLSRVWVEHAQGVDSSPQHRTSVNKAWDLLPPCTLLSATALRCCSPEAVMRKTDSCLPFKRFKLGGLSQCNLWIWTSSVQTPAQVPTKLLHFFFLVPEIELTTPHFASEALVPLATLPATTKPCVLR